MEAPEVCSILPVLPFFHRLLPSSVFQGSGPALDEYESRESFPISSYTVKLNLLGKGGFAESVQRNDGREVANRQKKKKELLSFTEQPQWLRESSTLGNQAFANPPFCVEPPGGQPLYWKPEIVLCPFPQSLSMMNSLPATN
jgi:hypothetical protein